MAGRKCDPNSVYRIVLHINNGYRYAATVTTEYTAENKRNRKYTQWGTVSGDNVFTPNLRYQMTPVIEREKLIFPADWDISAAEALNRAKHMGAAETEREASAPESDTSLSAKEPKPVILSPANE